MQGIVNLTTEEIDRRIAELQRAKADKGLDALCPTLKAFALETSQRPMSAEHLPKIQQIITELRTNASLLHCFADKLTASRVPGFNERLVLYKDDFLEVCMRRTHCFLELSNNDTTIVLIRWPLPLSYYRRRSNTIAGPRALVPGRSCGVVHTRSSVGFHQFLHRRSIRTQPARGESRTRRGRALRPNSPHRCVSRLIVRKSRR